LGNVYTCHGFFLKTCEFEKLNRKTFSYKLIEQFVHRGFGNLWQFTINKIHEIGKMTICISRHVSLGATIIKEQNVKTFAELLDEKVGPETTRNV
jgi:hypothetical protein